jgi:hypothetical protein
MQVTVTYPDWKAPAEDGKILIWPEPHEIIAQTHANQRALSSASDVRISRIPLNELRRLQRAALDHDDARPLVATGHQTELIHAGVWVKHVLINTAAKELEGGAIQFAVDTDSPKHLTLRWPGERMPITDDARITTAAWSGLLDAPSPTHLAKIADHFLDAAHHWNYQPVLPAVISSLRPETSAAGKLSPAIVDANLALDHSLGLEHRAMLVSPILLGEPYLAFVHHVMNDADAFAHVYNGALAEFRRAHKTKSPTRPMPDLFVSSESIEAPFWLDNLATGERSRPSVFRSDGGFVLELLSGDEFVFDRNASGLTAASKLDEWLRDTQHRLSPRALTLTTFIRMLIADNFVHGIGGGRYDQVSDAIIRDYFKLEPPAFAVTTGTLYFPEAVTRQRACVRCVLQEGHRLKHGLLGDRKMQFVSQINSLPHGSLERQGVFSAMHRQRKELLQSDPRIAKWEKRLRETQQRADEDETLFDRELFYAIQSRQRLLEMIERYDAAFRGT